MHVYVNMKRWKELKMFKLVTDATAKGADYNYFNSAKHIAYSFCSLLV